MSIRSLVCAAVVLLGCSLISACSDTGTEPEGGLELVGAVPARANPGWPLKDPVTVRLVDDDGEPRAQVPVTWLVTGGGGSVEPFAAETDADGVVRAVWTLGVASGENELVAAIAEGSSLTVGVTAEAFRADRIAASSRFACGLVDGAIWCWGDDAWTGTEHVSVPVDPFGWTSALDAPGPVDGPSNFVDVAASGSMVCGLDDEGTVHCATSAATSLDAIPELPAMRSIVGAATGVGDFCGLTAAESTVWCWGAAGPPEALAGSPVFTALYMDGFHSPGRGFLACGLSGEGSASCWGSGFLGNGTFDPSDTPVAVAGGHQFVEIGVNENSACGRTSGGEVWCWGDNDFGQLGVEGPDAAEPVLSDAGVDRIAAGHNIVLALKGAVVVSWGGEDLLMPSGPVASLAGFDVADFAKNSVGCVSLVDGQVYCYEWLWDRSTSGVFEMENYHPVHPVVEP